MDENEDGELCEAGSGPESPSSSSSSSSSSDSSEEERRRRRRHKKKRRQRRRRSRHRQRSQTPAPDSVPEQGDPPPHPVEDSTDGRYVEEGKVQMCSMHENDLRPLTCRGCKAMFHMIRKNLRIHLVVDGSAGPSAIPTAKDRLLSKRSDDQVPTLVLSEEEIAVLLAICGKVSIFPVEF